MRIGMVVVGVVVLIIGAALMFVPLSPQPSQTLTQTSESTPYAFTISGISLTGSIPISVSWTSNTTITLLAVACSGTCGNLSTLSGVTLQTGTSGSFSLSVPTGGTVEIGTITTGGTPSSTTVNVTTALTTVGTILLVVGILLLIVGLVLKRKPKGMAQPPAMPAQDSQPMAPPGQ